MSAASKMIFYDNRQRRKIYFRLAIFCFVSGIVFSLAFMVYSITNHQAKADYVMKTRTIYDYYYDTLTNQKKLVLTFDDGPNPKYTNAVLDILEKHQVPAMFFLIGSKVLKHEDIVKVIKAKGHEIGSHSFTHSQDVHHSQKRVQMELVSTGKLIRSITGELPIFYRPPYLLNIGIDPTINPYIPEEKPLTWAINLGYIPVGVDVDSRDWEVKTVDEIVTNVKKSAKTGHIILLHDGDGEGGAGEKTVASLDRIIVELQAEGYEFVTMSELLGINRNLRLKHDVTSATTDAEVQGRVTELQEFLKEQGFDYILTNGVFDAPTAFAVEEWRRISGIKLEHKFRAASTDFETDGEVSRLQRYLKENVDNKLHATGTFDIATVKALKSWQEQNDVPNNEYGIVGPNTRDVLLKLSSVPIIDATTVGGTAFERLLATIEYHLELGTLIVLATVGPVVLGSLKVVLLLVVLRSMILLGFYFYSLLRRKPNINPLNSFQPWVSVIIPAYNEGENIASTILSIARSSYPHQEILVINDGSKDNTAAVVERVARQYPQMVRLISIPNGGKANALNVGIAHAKYDIIITLDGDSIFGENTVANLVRHFENEKIGAVAGKVSVVDSSRLLGAFQSMEYITGQNIEKRAFAAVNAVNVIPGPVGAWRKELVIKLGGFAQDTLVEDQDLSMAIQTSGKRIIYEPDAVAYTETPVSLRDFMKQRFRWVFGTLQCFWKYKSYMFSFKRFSLGWIILPNVLVSNTIIPLFFPIVDFLSLFAIFWGNWDSVLGAYLMFTAFDFVYAASGFINEKGKLHLLIFLPLQRLFYRQIMYVIIIKSIIKAIEGTGALWNKVRRTGLTQKFFFENKAGMNTPAIAQI